MLPKQLMKFQIIKVSTIFLLLILIYHSQSGQCTVNETVTFSDCVIFCWDTYQGKKDFYQFSTGNCLERVQCGAGYYNDWENNICIDQFGGYILKQIGWTVKVKQQHVRFAQIQILRGYTVGNKLICDDGWKSSMKTQQKSDICIIIYLCDQQLKDGQIYPQTHGEYFFNKLILEQQVYVLDTVFGIDTVSQFFTLRINILLAFTCLYLCMNIIAFCISLKKNVNRKICCKSSKIEDVDKRLSESEKKEIEQFLQKRKEQKVQALGDVKYFSLKDQVNQQLQLMKQIKIESQQLLRRKFEKHIKQRLKQKKMKQIVKQSKQKKIKQRQQKQIQKKEKQSKQIVSNNLMSRKQKKINNTKQLKK